MQIAAYCFPILYHYTAPQFGWDIRNAPEVRNQLQRLICWCFECPSGTKLTPASQTAEAVCIY